MKLCVQCCDKKYIFIVHDSAGYENHGACCGGYSKNYNFLHSNIPYNLIRTKYEFAYTNIFIIFQGNYPLDLHHE